MTHNKLIHELSKAKSTNLTQRGVCTGMLLIRLLHCGQCRRQGFEKEEECVDFKRMSFRLYCIE